MSNSNVIYVYEDKWNAGKVVYVGKDKNGKRHYEHLNSKKPTKFERILQKNPDRYRFKPILQVLDDEWYEDMEGIMIWVMKKLGLAEHNINNELANSIRLALEE